MDARSQVDLTRTESPRYSGCDEDKDLLARHDTAAAGCGNVGLARRSTVFQPPFSFSLPDAGNIDVVGWSAKGEKGREESLSDFYTQGDITPRE